MCDEGDGSCLFGLPPVFESCVWRSDGEAAAAAAATLQEGLADAVPDGQEDASGPEPKRVASGVMGSVGLYLDCI